MEVESVLVTGTNRGIGLELVRQLVQLPHAPSYVFATYRNEDAIQDLKKIQESSKKSQVILIKMDITQLSDIQSARKKLEEVVGDRGLNLLINNAGAAKIQPFPTMTAENLEFHFNVNTVGPIMVFQVMLPLLEKAACLSSGGMSVSRAAVLNISSIVGSIKSTGVLFTRDLAVPGYKISKTALNMAMRVIAANVQEKGILVVMMCPGWVKTDMGGRDVAQIEPEESVSAILQTLPTLDEKHHGVYMDRFGNEYPF